MLPRFASALKITRTTPSSSRCTAVLFANGAVSACSKPSHAVHIQFNARFSSGLGNGTNSALVPSVAAEQDYHKIGDKTLETISDFLSPLEDDEETELEMSMGVLKLRLKATSACTLPHFRDKYITWVINKQTPNRQIWWSSPISGPRRYEWSPADQASEDLSVVASWKYSRAINHPSSSNGAISSEGSAGSGAGSSGRVELDLLQQLRSEVQAVTGVDLLLHARHG